MYYLLSKQLGGIVGATFREEISVGVVGWRQTLNSRVVVWRARSYGKVLAVVAVSAFALGITALPSGATTNPTNWPYAGGSPGYDVSYPQCSNPSSYTPSPSSSPQFAIIGIDGGRPFNANGCTQKEWGAALGAKVTSISIYINTGYSGAYAHDITSTCAADNTPYKVGSKLAQAWQIGCSEADFALNTAISDGVNPNVPTGNQVGGGMWWADVETGNSWSTNTSLNQATIQGVVTELAAPTTSTLSPEGGLPVGIYSNTTFWKKITGNTSWAPTSPIISPTPQWYAGSSCTSFAGSNPVWLAQTGTSSVGDPDTACPLSAT